MRPMVAQVAVLEPETAAKMALPTTLVCSSFPGMRCIQGDSPMHMASLIRVRNRISPIQMNNGNDVRVQLEDVPQMVSAIASPAGCGENSCMAIQATPDRVSPISTPLARIKKILATNNKEMLSSLIVVSL